MRAVVWLVMLVACGRGEPAPSTERPVRRVPRPATAGESTVAARDYIGPDACGECHPDQHAQWMTSLHRVMNQRATPEALIGDFRDVRVAYAGGDATFELAADGPVMRFARDGHELAYRVTRTIGRRGLQEYVGVADGRVDEVRLPFGYWPRRAAWYPQAYFDPWLAEDDLDVYAEVKEPWAERCPWCHSTYPFAERIERSSAREIGHGFEQFFELPPGARPERLDVASQVSVGISCESCHLGGRAHAAGAAIHFVPLGALPRHGAPAPTTFADERRDPAIVNTVCAQCHSGPSPRYPDGGALRNSSEALDLAASTCSARCTDCHDPHTGGSDETRAVAACQGCHAVQAQAAMHAGAGHAGVDCLDCHMPRVVMGVDRYVRTHRIGTPTHPAMLAAGAPNACNLCHLDRSIAWTAEALAAPASLRARLDRDVLAGEQWLSAREPGIRLVATMAYARASRLHAFALPALARGLQDPLPYVRTWTQIAIEEALGRRLTVDEYDARAPAERRAAQVARLSKALGR